MKKRFKIVAAIACMALLATGCGSNEEEKKDDSTKKTDEQIIAQDISGYVELGDYKGIEVEKQDTTVTDDEVTKEIDAILKGNPKTEEIKDRDTVKDGDIVVIDFKGFKDGKAFEGGESKDYELTIGSNSFIDGFEDGLIGAKVGKETDLNLTFPKDYNNKELAGQDVVFKVTVKKIVKKTTPELNDEFVKSYSKTAKTVDEFKKEIKDQLIQYKKDQAQNTQLTAILEAVTKNAKVKEYPQEQVDYYAELTKQQRESYLQYMGATLEQYLEMYGQTKEDYNKEIDEYARKSVEEKMCLQAIAKKENIKLSDEEHKKKIDEYVKAYEMKDADALYEAYGKETVEQSLIFDEVFDFLLENAKQVEPKATVAPSATPEATKTPSETPAATKSPR